MPVLQSNQRSGAWGTIQSDQGEAAFPGEGRLSGAVAVFHFYAPVALSLRRAGEEDAESSERGRRW